VGRDGGKRKGITTPKMKPAAAKTNGKKGFSCTKALNTQKKTETRQEAHGGEVGKEAGVLRKKRAGLGPIDPKGTDRSDHTKKKKSLRAAYYPPRTRLN